MDLSFTHHARGMGGGGGEEGGMGHLMSFPEFEDSLRRTNDGVDFPREVNFFFFFFFFFFFCAPFSPFFLTFLYFSFNKKNRCWRHYLPLWQHMKLSLMMLKI